jgi:hypothetical protein
MTTPLKKLPKPFNFFRKSPLGAGVLGALTGSVLLLSGCSNSPMGIDSFFGVTTDVGNTALTFSPRSFDFGVIRKATGSALTAITVKNSTPYTATIVSITGATADFAILSDTCPRSPAVLSAGSTCEIRLRFAPQAPGVLGAGISVQYTVEGADSTSPLLASVGLTGTGLDALNFQGVASIDQVTTTTLRLNWGEAVSAASYTLFTVDGSGALTYLRSIQAPAASAAVTGLTPNTAYKFRVRATDSLGSTDANVVDSAVTTDLLGVFDPVGASVLNEGAALGQVLNCHDLEGNTPVYSITAQTDSLGGADGHCSLAGPVLSCSPSFKAGHLSWSIPVQVSCALNGSIIPQTVTFGVNDLNRPPALTAISGKTVAAAAALAVSASASDADGDAVTYSCAYNLDGSATYATPCTNLGNQGGGNATFAAGVLTWTPSYAAGGVVVYARITANDVNGGSDTQLFPISVNPSFSGLASIDQVTSTSMRLNWTPFAGSTSYAIYRNNAGTLTAVGTVGAGVSQYAVTGLSPGTAYTFRVKAIDATGAPDANLSDVTATTDGGGTFTTIAAIATSEGATVPRALSCSDVKGSTPVYSIISQADSSGGTDGMCTIAGSTLTCAPAFKTGHAAWTVSLQLRCAINQSNVDQTVAISVADTNRAPVVPALTNLAIGAGSALSVAAASTDADGDAMTYTCAYNTNGTAVYPTACTTLANQGSGNATFTGGNLAWSPQFAAAGSYYFKISVDDANAAGLVARTFSVVVNSSFSGLASIDQVTSTSMRLNWTPFSGSSGYQVLQVVSGTPSLVQSVSSGLSANAVVSGLTPSTSYDFRVIWKIPRRRSPSLTAIAARTRPRPVRSRT